VLWDKGINILYGRSKSMAKVKTAKQMERHLKGMANHYRIEILLLLAEQRGITLESIVEILKANEKTIGEHTRRLSQAGLINKKYRGKYVEHTLSPYGKTFVRFLRSFQRT
jgi:DNA-binding transcriptional ArsR family regulator